MKHPIQVAPEIISPSMPNGTVLQCESGPNGCHIQLVTKPTPGSTSWYENHTYSHTKM
jgi:hypothetical protein